jgi:hypothetical protein
MKAMGCFLVLLVFAFPRFVMVLLFFFSNFMERAYHGLIIPILGFIFLPLTTLVYAWMVNSGYPTSGPYLLILLIAVVIDVGGHGGAYSRRRI